MLQRIFKLLRVDIVGSALFSMIIWLAMLAIDPFGIEKATGAGSRTLYQRVLAPFYPTAHQSEIAVVLISDEDIPLVEGGHKAWPPRFSEYATLLRNLHGRSGARPAAVFVDLLLDNQHNEDTTLPDLCEAIAETEALGVPVFFASVPNQSAATGPEYDHALIVDSCPHKVRLGGAGWVSDEGDYPLAATIGGRRELTAAAALYEHHLIQSDDPGRISDFEKRIEEGVELSVQWGGQAPVDDPSCANLGSTLSERALAALRIVFAGSGLAGGKRGEFEQVQPCLFHRVLSGGFVARASPFDKAGIDQEFSGATIFVGASIRGIPDILTSPVHGVAPGVFEHAMALDNLFNFGSRFYRDAPHLSLGGYSLPQDSIIQAALILLLALWLRSIDGPRLYPRTIAGYALAFANKTTIAAAFGALIVVAIAVSHFVFRFEPFNWGSIISIGMIMIYTKRFRHTDRPGQPVAEA